MSSNERFKEARKDAGLTQEKFGDEIGLKQTQVRDIESGKQKVSPELAELIEKNFYISGWWILTGNGNMKVMHGDKLPVALASHPEDDENTVALNYYPDIVAAAGYGGINESNVHPQIMKFDRRFLEEFLNVRRFDSIDIIRVIGDSMEPYIHDGEIVLVERHSDVRNGETVIASVNGHIYVKRYHADPFGKWIKLVSENRIYGSLELEGDQLDYFSIIGIVRAKIKAF